MLTWVAVKTTLKKAWAWCKKYWQILVGAAIPVVIWILTRDSGKLNSVLDRVREDHEKEIDAINKSHDQEIKDRDAAIERYNKTIAEIEKKYQEEKKTLSTKKKKEIEKILKDAEENPEEITRRLSEVTGFDIHVD